MSSLFMSEAGQETLPGTEPDQLTLNTLENHLWAAADKLHGSIDSADYESYIFGFESALFMFSPSHLSQEGFEELAENGVRWEGSPSHHC